jgi:hypothetical protein
MQIPEKQIKNKPLSASGNLADLPFSPPPFSASLLPVDCEFEENTCFKCGVCKINYQIRFLLASSLAILPSSSALCSGPRGSDEVDVVDFRG